MGEGRCRNEELEVGTNEPFLAEQLRKAVMDHISDSFLETNVPLLVLIEAAKSGNEKEVKEYAQVFREHANKLVEVSQERPED
ncbi:Catenin alpha-2 [Galemys pyrenaicus]|uniref:Catenin alpha-2 n=1 Tax=Galemys pyrenaicus TaxID=202257 RepID=A0A8J6DMZ0_GALPY|nr:Catenin alpha-2 [Galemys pyrenaicus]